MALWQTQIHTLNALQNVMQESAEVQRGSYLGSQLPASASGGSLAAPIGINPEDIAEGSIRFFHNDLCLSIPFKGEHFMSIDTIKALTPRELILLYEAKLLLAHVF